MNVNLDHIAKKLGLERKYKKLKKDPELFVKDMVFKRSAQIKKYIPIKYEGKNNFTIVSAVYNVSKYLDEYFESIVNQSLSFKKHIYIICVDDGSTDNSAEIIKKWQKKYPKNIQYIYKENGGQASARNLGLESVHTEWVTFIDPDDYLHPDYFKELDTHLVSDKKLQAVVTNILFYIEYENLTKDKHPLNYRFNGKETKCEIKNLKKNINLSASTTVFKSATIKENCIQFDENLKPVFEDGKFIADYILNCDSGNILFLKDAIYYYRKREDGSSTLDTAWGKEEKYYNVLKFGHLSMLQEYKAKYGYVPEHVQRTALYDISWYVKYLLNNSNKISFLTNEQQEIFLNLVFEIFTYIDEKTILDFNLAGIWFFQKVGMLGMFKNTQPENLIVYIENIDKEKKQILFSYFTYFELGENFNLNNQDILPVYEKNTVYDFVDQKFVIERRVWLPYDDENSILNIHLNQKNARLSLQGKQYKNGLPVKSIIQAFKPSKKYEVDGSWVLMDRDIQADDNAEHLYRYIKNNHPEQKIFFALRKDSHDWTRLQQEGFELLNYGSSDFELKLRACSKIISSHLDRYVNNYFGDEYEYSKKFVFLQHGLTKDDMSNWFNSKKNLQCLVTTSPFEYESIINNNNHYKLTNKEVVLTGFPRHDKLLESNKDQNILLIMPTWRNSIVGKTVGNGNIRELNFNFMDTLYAKSWHSVLHSEKLKELSEAYNYKIVFAPHANISPYLNEFNVPNYIQLWSANTSDSSMQELFQKSKIMLTDYSSVAFEMGYLQKAVLYYQFDHEQIFSGDHIYQKGYFDYEDHGFGPVVYALDTLIDNLENILKNDGRPTLEYLDRMNATFPFRDGKCCERVYEAILELDKPDTSVIDIDVLIEKICIAEKFKDYECLENRCNLLIDLYPDQVTAEIYYKLIKSLIYQAKYEQAKEILSNFYHYDLAVLLSIHEKNWVKLVDLLDKKEDLDSESVLWLLYACIHLKNSMIFRTNYQKYISNISEQYQIFSLIFNNIINQEWNSVILNIHSIQNQLDDTVMNELYTKFNLPVFLSMSYRMLEDYDNARQSIHSLKVDDFNLDPFFILEKANIQFYDEANNLVIYWYDRLLNNFGLDYFDDVSISQYSIALVQSKNWSKISELAPQWIIQFPEVDQLKYDYVNALENLNSWSVLREFYKAHKLKLDKYVLILSAYRLGMVREAYNLIEKPTFNDDYEYWRLVAEISILEGDSKLGNACYKGMISIFPEKIHSTIELFDTFFKLSKALEG